MAAEISQNAALPKDNSTIVRRTGNHQPNLWGFDFIQSLRSSYGESCYRERAEACIREIKGMFNAMGDGEISPSAYDTAWVARVAATDGKGPQFPQTVDWILQNQLKDGSWGTASPFLLSERLLSTLSCVLALKKWNIGHHQLEQGLAFMRKNLALMSVESQDNLVTDFELIFPSLIKEAHLVGLSLPHDLPWVEHIFTKRQERLARISVDQFRGVPLSLLYSLESLQDIMEIDWERIMDVQCKDGSFLGSPSSTAYVLMHTGDRKCLAFLNSVLAKFGNYVPCLYPVDILQRLLLVDNVERLGIDRHFETEIKEALDYVYRYWDDERGIGCGRGSPLPDLEITALGFRLLRLHRYNVSPVVLEKFKDQISGEFTANSPTGQSHVKEVASMLSLYRASQIAFPGEEVMDEAKNFTIKYLTEALTTVGTFSGWNNKHEVGQEIKYALENPWRSNVPRLEARRYCQAYRPDYAWLGKSIYKLPLVNNQKYLELAKLDFNILQSVHQKEMKEVTRWFDRDSGLNQFTFARARPIEFFFMVCAGTFECELSACRINFAKVASLQTILDDMYDTYGTLDELILFTEAVKKWDSSKTENLPNYMKACYRVWFDIVHQVTWEAEKVQSRELLEFFRTVWEEYLDSYLEEAEWLAAEHVPTLDAYIKNGLDSIGTRLLLLSGIFFLGQHLPENILQQIDRPAKFIRLIGLITRFIDDAKTYKAEKARGELASAIQCYMKDNPESTEDEALSHLHCIIDCSVKELTCEFLKADDVPVCFKKYLWEFARATMLMLKDADGISISATDTKRLITETLIEPLPVTPLNSQHGIITRNST